MKILNRNSLDYTVTQGIDYTINKHIKQQFTKVGHVASAKEIGDVIECDKRLYMDFVRTSSSQVRFLIWKFTLHLIGSDPAYDNITINKYAHLGSSTNLKVQEIGQKSHTYVLDTLRQQGKLAPLIMFNAFTFGFI